MKPKRPLPSVFRLRQKWRAFAMMAVVFARALLRLERAGGWDARAHAGDLELRLRVAITEINADIAEIAETAPPETEEETDALNHLRAISLAMLGLVLFLREMKARLPNKGSGVFACGGMAGWVHAPVLQAAAPTYAPGYLDSS